MVQLKLKSYIYSDISLVKLSVSAVMSYSLDMAEEQAFGLMTQGVLGKSSCTENEEKKS